MPELAQHVIVTLTALGAAWFIAHRVFAAVRPAGSGKPSCANCASAQQAKPVAAAGNSPAPSNAVQHAVLHEGTGS